MPFNELVSPSLTDLFTKKIEEMILSGELKPGEKLPTERELSESMRVSRAVINSGVGRLERTGFLRVVPRKGTYVVDYVRDGNIDVLTSILEYSGTRFTPELFDPLIQCLYHLEPPFFALAAKNAAPQQLDRMDALKDQLKLCRNVEQVAENVFAFIHESAIASGNIIWPLINRTLKPIYVCLCSLDSRFASRETVERVYEMEERLMAALRRGDAEAAEKISQSNIMTATSWLRQAYSPGDIISRSHELPQTSPGEA